MGFLDSIEKAVSGAVSSAEKAVSGALAGAKGASNTPAESALWVDLNGQQWAGYLKADGSFATLEPIFQPALATSELTYQTVHGAGLLPGHAYQMGPAPTFALGNDLGVRTAGGPAQKTARTAGGPDDNTDITTTALMLIGGGAVLSLFAWAGIKAMQSSDDKVMGQEYPFYKDENPTREFYPPKLNSLSTSEANLERAIKALNTDEIELQRVQLDKQGYTSGGTYYGVGAPLFMYEVWDSEGPGRHDFFRAADHSSAKSKLKAMYPRAKIVASGASSWRSA